MSSSSISYLRPSAMCGVFISQNRVGQTRSSTGAQLAQLPVDLGLDVQRRLSLARAALVAGDDELPDLLAQRGIGGRAGASCAVPGERVDLGLHVERRLPARLAAG